MNLNAITPVLWVKELRATIDYYVSILGFAEENHVAEWGWGVVKRDEVSIMLSKPNEHIPFNESQFTGSLYLGTDEVDAWWEHLRDKANIYYDIENFEYGMREFAIKDCNGYILQFGQDISS